MYQFEYQVPQKGLSRELPGGCGDSCGRLGGLRAEHAVDDLIEEIRVAVQLRRIELGPAFRRDHRRSDGRCASALRQVGRRLGPVGQDQFLAPGKGGGQRLGSPRTPLWVSVSARANDTEPSKPVATASSATSKAIRYTLPRSEVLWRIGRPRPPVRAAIAAPQRRRRCPLAAGRCRARAPRSPAGLRRRRCRARSVDRRARPHARAAGRDRSAVPPPRPAPG